MCRLRSVSLVDRISGVIHLLSVGLFSFLRRSGKAVLKCLVNVSMKLLYLESVSDALFIVVHCSSIKSDLKD